MSCTNSAVKRLAVASTQTSIILYGGLVEKHVVTQTSSSTVAEDLQRNPLNVQFNENVVFFPLNTEVLTVYYDCPNFSPIRSHSSYIGELDAVNGIRNYYVTKNLTSPSLDDIRGGALTLGVLVDIIRPQAFSSVIAKMGRTLVHARDTTELILLRALVPIVIIILVGIIALVVFLCPCFRVQIFRKRKTSDERRQEMLRALIPLKHYTYAQVKKITQSFAEVVGRGGFGVVYRGTLCDGRMVAVKDLGQGDNVSPTEYGIRSEEEEIAKKMKIVGLWCIQSSPSNRPPMNIVVEMMEGSLEALEVPPMPVLQQIPAARLSQSFWDSGEGSSASEVLIHGLIFVRIHPVFELLCSSSEYEGTTNNRFHSRRFSENKSEIQTEGAAIITPDGLLRLTDRNLNVTGTAFYRKPVRLLNHSNLNLSTKAEVCSFSTSLLFILVPSKSRNGGFGFTFTLSPTPVEFDTVQGFRDGADARGNHIGLNFNSVTSDVQEPVVYTSDEGRKEDFQYETESIRVRLDYNGSTQMLNLIVSPAKFPIAPSIPLISQRVPKLLDIVQEEMYVGFTAGDMSRVLTI
ncbi:hypothetical protein Bca101_048699 [Brassica carinata]